MIILDPCLNWFEHWDVNIELELIRWPCGVCILRLYWVVTTTWIIHSSSCIVKLFKWYSFTFLYRNVMTMQSYKAGTRKLKSLYKFLLVVMYLSCCDPTYDHQLSGTVSIAFCVVFLQWLKTAATALSNLKKMLFITFHACSSNSK